MWTKLTSCFQTAFDILQKHPFCTGFICGILLVLLLILLFSLSRIRRISSLSFSTERGSVSVSTAAVTALIKALVETSFPGILLQKVLLCRKQRRIFLKIIIDFNAAEGNSLSSSATLLQTESIRTLREHFGISDIDQVLIQVRHSRFPSGKKKTVRTAEFASDTLDAESAEPASNDSDD